MDGEAQELGVVGDTAKNAVLGVVVIGLGLVGLYLISQYYAYKTATKVVGEAGKFVREHPKETAQLVKTVAPLFL